MKKCRDKCVTFGGESGVTDAGEAFREFVRGQVREVIIGVMEAEVESLCGPSHHRQAISEFYRAGSAPGFILHEGRRHEVKRPRVRQRLSSGSGEVVLQSYAEAQDATELRGRLMEALRAGVSGREQSRLHDKNAGTSKSEVSRLWRAEGKKLLVAFRSRDIRRSDWVCLMLDGVVLERDLVAVVALGITADGVKLLLDFELGASENVQTAKNLLERLVRRGFAPADGYNLLSVLDGAAALKTAVLSYFPKAEIQRCLVHKERNLRRYMRKSEHAELSEHFDRLRHAQGAAAGHEALASLEKFLSRRNEAALESLREAGGELICLHRLNVPATLNASLLSTNLIENPFRNVRRKTSRVCRWRRDTEQASRWLAMALQEAESGFRRLRNHKDLAKLRDALRVHRE